MDFLLLSYPLAVPAMAVPVALYAAAMLAQYARERMGRAQTDIVPAAMGFAGGFLACVISVFCLAFGSGALNTLLCALGIAGGALGITGGALVGRKRKTAGLLMLAGAVASWATAAGALALLLGAAGALADRKQALSRKWALLAALLICAQLTILALGAYGVLPPVMAAAMSVAVLLGWMVLAVLAVLSQEKERRHGAEMPGEDVPIS
jgi:hypothetical protein